MGLRARRFGIAALDGLGGPSYRFPQIVTALSIVRGDSAVEFRVIGDPGKQAPHANSMDRRTGGNGSTPRMEPARDPVQGSAQRDSVLLGEGLAGDPAHAALSSTAAVRTRIAFILSSLLKSAGS